MSSYGAANDGGFVSNFAGISDSVGLKGDAQTKAAARRQNQRGVFAQKAHERLMSSAAFLSQTGFAVWGEVTSEWSYNQDEVA